MLMNFGPINRSGGEKRLNVAFSRAKQHMAIVSTIRYSAITNEYNEGANCCAVICANAESMSHGDSASAQRVLNSIIRWKGQFAQEHSDTEDGVVVQLADHLRAQGYLVDLGVGQSHFRVDLAVRLPTDSGYRLGILIDTPIQYEQVESLERDVLRPRLLHNFGWQVTSVLAKDWYENQQEESERLLKILADNQGDDSLEAEESDDEDRAEQRFDSAMAPGTHLNDVGSTAHEELDDATTKNSLKVEADSIPMATLISRDDVASDCVTRRFEYKQDQSNKFWEITVNGLEHTVRFGKIGKSGQTQTKSFPSAAAAQQGCGAADCRKTTKGICRDEGVKSK